MKNVLVIAAIVVIGAAGYWWLRPEPVSVPDTSQGISETPSVTGVDATVTTPAEAVTMAVENTYVNKTWGIQFEYPNDWQVYEQTFKAGSSLFNVMLQPVPNTHLPDPIIVNVTPADWGKTLYDRAKSNGAFREVIIATYPGIVYSSTDMGLPTEVYLFKVSTDVWIMLIGKVDYEDTLNQVLESLVITSVEIDLVE